MDNKANYAGEAMGSTGQHTAASRQSGKHALLDVVRRMRREATALEDLALAIPDNFPADADTGLWQLVIARRS